jgi:hypothetical protein
MGPDSIWFWLIIGVSTALIVAVGKWVWSALTDTFREWIREPITEAKVRAETAANHAEKITDALGVPNGHGNLIEMVERLLAQQGELLANQEESQRWQRDHDVKDDQTRMDVGMIKDHLGL